MKKRLYACVVLIFPLRIYAADDQKKFGFSDARKFVVSRLYNDIERDLAVLTEAEKLDDKPAIAQRTQQVDCTIGMLKIAGSSSQAIEATMEKRLQGDALAQFLSIMKRPKD